MFKVITAMFKKREGVNVTHAFIESYARKSRLEEEFIAEYQNSLHISRITAVDLMLIVMMYGLHLAIRSRAANNIIVSTDKQGFELTFFLTIIESVLQKAGDNRDVKNVAQDLYGKIGILDSLTLNLPQGQQSKIVETAAKEILKIFAEKSSKDASEIYRVTASIANEMNSLIELFDNLHKQRYSL